MMTKDLTRALLLLITFSLVTTLFAGFLPESGPVFVVSVLLLALLKGRVILLDYLGLRQAPSFRRGFVMALVAFTLLALGLYAVPFLR